jgi:hypothetical protein
VGKSRRGTATGFASSAAATGVLVFALILLTGFGDRYTIVIASVTLAACLWIAGAMILATLKEYPSETDDTRFAAQLSLVRDDPQLVRFIAVRCLLVGTALAPPFLVLLQPDSGLDQLGALVLASALASLISSYVWGRSADKSSASVLRYAGLAGGAVLALVVVLALSDVTAVFGVLPLALFGLMIAYHGVRQARSTHLVDMAGPEDRSRYTALSNTVVGLFLLAAGGIAAVVASLSVPLVIGLFAAMCFLAAAIARGLEEVQS